MFFILAEIILQHVDVRTHFTHIHKDVALPRLQTILFSSDLGGHFEWRTAIGGPALHAAGQVQLCEHLCLGNCFILRGGSEGKENKMLDDSLDSCIDWYVFFFMCAWRHVCFHCHNKNITCGNVRSAIHLCSQLCVYVSTRKCLPQFESTSMYVIMCDCLSMYACNACLCVCVCQLPCVCFCVSSMTSESWGLSWRCSTLLIASRDIDRPSAGSLQQHRQAGWDFDMTYCASQHKP